MGEVIEMGAAAKLIREAREARAVRRAARDTDRWADLHKPQYPGGIDDIEVGN
jgi:hypothetical protein